MAKEKPKGTAYENKQATQYSREGLNLRDLIAQQAGGTDKASFEKFLQGAGLSRKNQRQLSKAYDQIQNTDREYILDKEGTGFNVFDKTQNNAAQTTSGRGKGNTKGLSLADLVGLGNNVSKLAGFANSNRDRGAEALKDKVAFQKPSKDEGQVTDPFAPTTAVAGPAGPAPTSSGKRTSGKVATKTASAPAKATPGITDSQRKSQDLIMNQNAPDDGLPNWGGVALPGKGPSEEEQVRRQIFSAAAQGSIMSNWEPFALENKKKALTNQLNNRAAASPGVSRVDLAKNIDTEQRTEAANTRKSAMAAMELGATILGGVGTAGLLAKGTRFAWAGAKKGAQMLGKKFAKKAATTPPPAPKPRIKMPQVSPYAKGGKIELKNLI